MNGHNRTTVKKIGHTTRSVWLRASLMALTACFPCSSLAEDVRTTGITIPEISRIAMQGSKAYSARKVQDGKICLFELRELRFTRAGTKEQFEARWTHTSVSCNEDKVAPQRWDISDGGWILATHTHNGGAAAQFTDISRFSLQQVFASPSPAGQRELWKIFPHDKSFQVGTLKPLADAFAGFLRRTKGGYEWGPSTYPTSVYYDIFALGAKRINLVMAIDGKLSEWTMEGEEWSHVSNFDFEVTSDFLLFRRGKDILTKIDGDWCIVSDFRSDDPKITSIVSAANGDRVTLIEDRSAGKAFFELGEDIFDASGKRIARIPKSVESNDRVREIVRNIRAERERH